LDPSIDVGLFSQDIFRTSSVGQTDGDL